MVMSEKKLNLLISKKILEIFIVLGLLILSYYVLIPNNLSQSASIAQSSIENRDNLQMLYKRTGSSNKNIMAYENLVDELTLSVKNLSDRECDLKVSLVFTNNIEYIKTLSLYFEGTKIELSNVKEENGKYTIYLGSIHLNPYSIYESKIQVEGDPFMASSYNFAHIYTFEHTEKFL